MPDEFDSRKADFEPLPPTYTTGVLAKYTQAGRLGRHRRGLRIALLRQVFRPPLTPRICPVM